VTVLEVRYRRLQTKDNGEYPYAGCFVFEGVTEEFPALFYRQLIGRLHDLLKEHPTLDRLLFQRTERRGILPFELGPGTFQLLREDPVAAYRAMTVEIDRGASVSAATLGTEGATFGRYLYLRIQRGEVSDPLTGQRLNLAYGEKQGWKIRAQNSASDTWLPLFSVIDDAPLGATAIERIAYMHWALLDVEYLLKLDHPAFYLPCPWNTTGPWVTREELQQRYAQCYAQRKEGMS
jgi:hypothetical protein